MKASEEEILTKLEILENKLAELILFYKQNLDFTQMVYQYWNAKDILGHLTFWHESFARNLQDLGLGKKPVPLRGKLSEVNRESVESTKKTPLTELLKRLVLAQNLIRKHIVNESITLIPYKIGSRPYPRLEHLEIVSSHINKHLKDLIKVFK